MKNWSFGIILLLMLIWGCVSGAKSSGGMTLDQAIKEAAVEINDRIPTGARLAIINFNSTSNLFSEYVIDEITANLVINRNITIVDRREIDLIRNEFNFQLSGDVSDDSMQELGRMLGAQSIVSGSLIKIGSTYRIVIRILNVQSAAVEVQYRTDIVADSRVQALLEEHRPDGTVIGSTIGQVSQTPSQTDTPRPPSSTSASFTQPTTTTALVQQPIPTQPSEIPEGIEFVISNNEVQIVQYTGNATTLHIPERIQGLPVTSIDRRGNSIIPGGIPNRSTININIPSTVTEIGLNALTLFDSLENIIVDSRNPIFTSIDGVLFDKNIQTILSYPAGRKAEMYEIPASVTVIGHYSFDRNRSLISIIIPPSVTAIEWTAFANCENLKNITIPSSVTRINNAFFGCRSLTSIHIPYSVTFIGGSTFTNCNSLTSITVDNRNPAYTSIDGVLFDKAVQTIIAYPPGAKAEIYSIPNSVITIGDSAFDRRLNLKSINIPSSVTTIRRSAFSTNPNLTNINLPNSITTIGDGAFWLCGFTSINIPSSLSTISSHVFGHTKLTSINIPSTVKIIERDAFVGCNDLTNVTLSRQTQVRDGAFPQGAIISFSD